MSDTADKESQVFTLQHLKRYEIHSADGRYVQGTGVTEPLKLVAMPSKITVWQAVEAGKTGRFSFRSPSGWYATIRDDPKDGSLIEDPNTGTQWTPTVVVAQFLTLSHGTEQFWSTRPGSDEIWLDSKAGSPETQGWRFIAVAGPE